jgi:hypothetical protein
MLCAKDTVTKIGHKLVDSSFYGCKTHLAMSEEYIITAALVTLRGREMAHY